MCQIREIINHKVITFNLSKEMEKIRYILSAALLLLVVNSNLFAQQADHNEMVLIPEGEFLMGCNHDNEITCMEAAKPAHKVFLKAYKIDKYMVTYKRYNECIRSGKCTDLYAGGGCNAGMSWNANHPVNCVTYKQAQDYCKSQGKRLPTEAEWEKAARGTDGRIFPWGNEEPSCELAVMNQKVAGQTMGPGCGRGTTREVGSRPKGASPYGVLDMAGNLFEWTSDWYSDTYFDNSPYKNPQGPSSGIHKVLKGSSWLMRTKEGMAATIRSGYSPLGQGYVVGFRCVKDID
jgi:iron(II)-dependent oxidoreductase